MFNKCYVLQYTASSLTTPIVCWISWVGKHTKLRKRREPTKQVTQFAYSDVHNFCVWRTRWYAPHTIQKTTTPLWLLIYTNIHKQTKNPSWIKWYLFSLAPIPTYTKYESRTIQIFFIFDYSPVCNFSYQQAIWFWVLSLKRWPLLLSVVFWNLTVKK